MLLESHVITDKYDVDVGNTMIRSFLNHSWYLSPAVVVFSLADPDSETLFNYQILKFLNFFAVPKEYELRTEKA